MNYRIVQFWVVGTISIQNVPDSKAKKDLVYGNVECWNIGQQLWIRRKRNKLEKIDLVFCLFPPLLFICDLDRKYVKAYIDFPKPLVAVVNGPAVGVSVTVLGLFDLVYATDRVSVLIWGQNNSLLISFKSTLGTTHLYTSQSYPRLKCNPPLLSNLPLSWSGHLPHAIHSARTECWRMLLLHLPQNHGTCKGTLWQMLLVLFIELRCHCNSSCSQEDNNLMSKLIHLSVTRINYLLLINNGWSNETLE